MKKIEVMDQFQRDVIRLVATLSGPILIAAMLIGALLLLFDILERLGVIPVRDY